MKKHTQQVKRTFFLLPLVFQTTLKVDMTYFKGVTQACDDGDDIMAATTPVVSVCQ